MNQALQAHHQSLANKTLLELFQEQPGRAGALSLAVGGLYLDYSRNHLTGKTLDLLCAFAESQGMTPAIQALLNGEAVNNTEQRPAFHTALREPPGHSAISQLVQSTLNKMARFVERVHLGQQTGFSGKAIDTVVVIGTGGSSLGPRMVTRALSAFRQHRMAMHFIANVDGADLEDTLHGLNPETTLFVIASKTFTTLETLSNANSARQWLLDSQCASQQVGKHLVAITANHKAAVQFGITEDHIFSLWDWVGGRYSLWSAIGLPIALAIGMTAFRELLAGAHIMDQHFGKAPLSGNMPVVAALIGYWYSHYWGTTCHAVLPYAQRLSEFPVFLQQLDMESLGKRVSAQGESVSGPTGSVIWGAPGTQGQHSFYQLLYQGTHLIPVDFIAVKKSMSRYRDQHLHLLASCIAQSRALMQGKDQQQVTGELREQGFPEEDIQRLTPHKVIPGNKPSNTLIMNELNPFNLGSLIAFYEHRVYASSVLFGINAFDQWGVELGKRLSGPLYRALRDGSEKTGTGWDESTRKLLEKLGHGT